MLALPTLVLQIVSGQADQLGASAAILNGAATGSQLRSDAPPPLNVAALGLQYLLSIMLIPFVEGAITLAAIDVAMGRPATLASCLKGVLRRYWALLGLALFGVLLVPLLLCFPLFLWILVRWAVSVPALLAEGIGPIGSIRRSWQLTRDNWWRLFGILAVVVIIQAVMSWILGVAAVPIAVLIPFASELVRGSIAITISTLGTAVVTPILYLCFVLLYFDLRIRKESFDLDQLAAQVSGGGRG
jgi:Membrane domain of glycerophosphoryl diester phosphodiesterase